MCTDPAVVLLVGGSALVFAVGIAVLVSTFGYTYHSTDAAQFRTHVLTGRVERLHPARGWVPIETLAQEERNAQAEREQAERGKYSAAYPARLEAYKRDLAEWERRKAAWDAEQAEYERIIRETQAGRHPQNDAYLDAVAFGSREFLDPQPVAPPPP